MHRRPNIRRRQINRQIWLLWRLIRIIHARETLNLAIPRLLINTLLISLLRIFQRRINMDKIKTAILLHRLPRRFPRILKRRNRRRNGCRTRFGQFGGHEGDARDVLVAVGAREAEFAAEFVADGFAEEEGDGAAALLVQRYVEGARDGVFAAVCVAG